MVKKILQSLTNSLDFYKPMEKGLTIGSKRLWSLLNNTILPSMRKDVMKELKEGQDINMVKEKDPKQPTLNYGVPG